MTYQNVEITTKKHRNKIDRQQQILEILARLLGEPKEIKITTALIAKELNLSEAALYRNFASKAQMFEGLINYMDQTIKQFCVQLKDASDIQDKQKILLLIEWMLSFSESNPGLTKILTGHAVVYEHERLREKVNHIYDCMETTLRQIYRNGGQTGEFPGDLNASLRARMVVDFIAGRWSRFVSSGFHNHPELNDKRSLAIFIAF